MTYPPQSNPGAYAPQSNPGQQGVALGKTRSPFGVWILNLVTLGIYGLVWHYKVNEEVKNFARLEVSPGMAVVALTIGGCLVVPPIMTIVNTGSRIGQAQQAAQLQEKASGGVGFLLAILGGWHLMYYQANLNKIWARYGQA